VTGKTAVGTGDSRVDKAFELISQMNPDELRDLNLEIQRLDIVPYGSFPLPKERSSGTPIVRETHILLHTDMGEPAILFSLRATYKGSWKPEEVKAERVEPEKVDEQDWVLAVYNDNTAELLLVSELEEVFGPEPLLLKAFYDGIRKTSRELEMPLEEWEPPDWWFN